MDFNINSAGNFSSEEKENSFQIDKVIYLYTTSPNDKILAVLKGYFKDIEKREYLSKEFTLANDQEMLVVFDCTNLDDDALLLAVSLFYENHISNRKLGYIMVGTVDTLSTSTALRKYGGLYSTIKSLSTLINDIIRSEFKLLMSVSASEKVKNGCMIISCAGGSGSSNIANEIALFLSDNVENTICLYEKNRHFRTLGILNEITQDQVSLDDLTSDVVKEHFKTFASEIRKNLLLYSLEALTEKGGDNHNLIEKLLSGIYYYFISDYSFSEVYTQSKELSHNAKYYDKYFFVVNGSLSSLINLCKLMALFKESGVENEKLIIIYNDNGCGDIPYKAFIDRFKGIKVYHLSKIRRGDYVSAVNSNRIKLSNKYRNEIHRICLSINNNVNFKNKKERLWMTKSNLFSRKR